MDNFVNGLDKILLDISNLAKSRGLDKGDLKYCILQANALKKDLELLAKVREKADSKD